MDTLRKITKVVGSAAVFALCSSAHAEFTMRIADNNPGYEQTTDSHGKTVTASLSAWANTNGSDGSAGAEFQQVSNGLVNYGSGLGIRRSGEGNPNHAIDNNGPEEFVLFVFDKPIAMTDLWIGWPDSGLDTDMSVLAYTADDAFNSNDLSILDSASLLSSGWDLVGDPNFDDNLADVDSDQFVSIQNTDGVSSTHWLVGAYNKHLAGAVNGLTGDDDYAKLKKIKGYIPKKPPGNGVPTPGTLALMGLGMIFLSRKRAQR